MTVVALSEAVDSIAETVNRQSKTVGTLRETVARQEVTVVALSEAVDSIAETVSRQSETVGTLRETVARQSVTVEALGGMVAGENRVLALLASCIIELVAERESMASRDGPRDLPPQCNVIATDTR